ncbi:HSP20-like chaperone [Rhizodiscina lignyota]|uniref:HSP20-like chaperone n=1 Tax=Rhizodiscina lignyota TaxID=1504668 RepID=A0A9P4IGX6_9PEZI|nr:HSP20-like chaperone [Rhizodiscina lignyota]
MEQPQQRRYAYAFKIVKTPSRDSRQKEFRYIKMAAYLYSSAFPLYLPELYNVSFLNKTFPEHHMPLYNARHKMSQGFHNFWHESSFPSPRADVRETIDKYYIDIELPGLENKDSIKLKWTNSNTLLLQVTAEPPAIPEGASDADSLFAPEAKKTEEHGPPHHLVHQLIKERHVGPIMRAFFFPVSVDRDEMTAKLQYGLLRIVVPKTPDAKVEHKEIDIEHTGA